MNKKIVSSAVFAGSFCLAGLASGQSITAPAGIPATFPLLLTQIATYVGTFIATLGTIMLIVAGIMYLMSAGNPQKVEAAKKALIYAVAGIVIGLAANAIAGTICSVLHASC